MKNMRESRTTTADKRIKKFDHIAQGNMGLKIHFHQLALFSSLCTLLMGFGRKGDPMLHPPAFYRV